MPQTKDDLRSAQLDKREAALAALQEQVRRDGDHLHAEAKAKCAGQLAQIDQREAALAPKETALQTREDAVSQREKAVNAREQAATEVELTQREAKTKLSDQSASLAMRGQSVTAREEQHQRLHQADLDVIEQRRKVLQEELSIREARINDSLQALMLRDGLLEKREASVGKLEEKSDALLKTAQQRDETSRDESKKAQAAQDVREYSLTEMSDRLAKREAALEERSASVATREQAVAQQEHDLNRMAKGLNKAKLDIETKEAQVEKRERLVNAIAKRKEVADELAKLE